MTSITIERDDNAESPRQWDNMGTMIACHRRYTLGDDGHGFNAEDYNGWDDLEKDILAEHRGGIILPLYLYDHSGLTMNTTGFSCPWDSGQVGFIVASGKKIREAYGVKRLSNVTLAKAEESLRAEVATFDQYLRGDVYGFQILDDEDNVSDSCWGFYGSDPFENGMSDHIPIELHDKLREAAP